MYRPIKEVKPQKNFLLLLTYKNGEQRHFDMKPYLETGIFRELKQEALFYSVKPSFDTVAWANDADMDPEILYAQSRKVA